MDFPPTIEDDDDLTKAEDKSDSEDEVWAEKCMFCVSGAPVKLPNM